MSLKHNILANYVSLAHVPNPSIPVGGFLERRGCFSAPGISVFLRGLEIVPVAAECGAGGNDEQ